MPTSRLASGRIHCRSTICGSVANRSVVDARRGRDPGGLERVEGVVRGDGRAPRADRVVELVVRGLATGDVVEPFVLREVGASEHLGEGAPRVVVGDGEPEPTTVGALVHALRRAVAVAVAEPLGRDAELQVDEHVAELGQHVLALPRARSPDPARSRRGSEARRGSANAPAGPVTLSMCCVDGDSMSDGAAVAERARRGR